jgi:AGCS family alanine or glycine:cation symporter
MENLVRLLTLFNNFIWGFPMLILLVGTGLYLTFRLRFIQIIKLPTAFKYILKPVDESGADGDVSSFHALSIALASTIGTGNIIGVALAITLGGPGALFWMWLTGLIGMPTKYAECMLAVKYRIKDDLGNMAGGPMYYLERGFKNKPLAKTFAFLALSSSIFGGSFPQANSMVDILTLQFRIEPLISTISIALIIAYISFGGIKRISRMAGIVIPFVAVFFILGSGIIILLNISQVPLALNVIFKSAFGFTSAAGGVVGSSVAAAINNGVRRGAFSNEAGNGTSPIAAATAITKSPVRQGLIHMIDVFIDTHVINIQMGLLIIMTGAYEYSTNSLDLVNRAFKQVASVSVFGEIILTICLIFFAFTTIIAWQYYGEQCSSYLFGTKSIPIYKVVFVIFIAIGALLEIDVVFLITDASIALMVIPNVVGVLWLSPEVIKDTQDYFKKPSSDIEKVN